MSIFNLYLNTSKLWYPEHPADVYSELAGAWVAGVADTDQHVEVDMGMPYKFTAVQIQGRADADEWVTSFKIMYYDGANASWVTYKADSGQEVGT